LPRDYIAHSDSGVEDNDEDSLRNKRCRATADYTDDSTSCASSNTSPVHMTTYFAEEKGNANSCTSSRYERLPLEYWERSDDCKEAKWAHMDRLDRLGASRERLVLLTTLWEEDTVLEPNMFPYVTPSGIKHYTLWSVHDMTHNEICSFVEDWLLKHMPQVRRWEYDDNSGDRSINLFHVHVFIETVPYSFYPTDMSKIYRPLHSL